MEKIKLFSILLMALAVGTTSCSKGDNKDDNPYIAPNTPVTPVTPVDDQTTTDSTDFYNYYGAELFSNESFKYGKFEAKMQMAYAPGCISSMFLYYNNSDKGGSYQWNEIDIEVIGKQPNGFQSNIITGKKGAQVTTEKMHNMNTPLAGGYHIYTMEWTPTYVAWYVDGELKRKAEGSTDTKNQIATLVEEQSLRFNLWSSKATAWVGQFTDKSAPITQYIDYVKVYDYDEATGEFSERWIDEFDEFDTSRWSKGNWRMENVMERTSNVVVEDGVLQLRLTKEPKNN